MGGLAILLAPCVPGWHADRVEPESLFSGAWVLRTTVDGVTGMTTPKEQRSQLIAEYRVHETDSGSPEVQIALLTADIVRLTEHMKRHAKDFHSRQGLLKKVNRRNKLLGYLNRNEHDRYLQVIQKLGLRR